MIEVPCKSNFPQNLYNKIPKWCARSCTMFGSQTTDSQEWRQFKVKADGKENNFCFWFLTDRLMMMVGEKIHFLVTQ